MFSYIFITTVVRSHFLATHKTAQIVNTSVSNIKAPKSAHKLSPGNIQTH